MKTFLLPFLTLSLVSCATLFPKSRYKEKVAALVGQPAETLFTTFGPPTRSLQTPNGNTMYVYDKVGPTRATADTWGQDSYATAETLTCTTAFTVGPDKVIKSFYFEGKACR